MRTLLIDDDPFALSFMRTQLLQLGIADIHGCQCAKEAAQLMEAEPDSFELTLCDLQMPGVDGVEFVRHLAQIDYRGALVLVSGEDLRVLQAAERLALAHRLQVLGTLTKPVHLGALRGLLDRHSLDVTPNSASSGTGYSPARLQQAIECGELLLHYQPKINLISGAVLGVEALVRWQHPQDGLVGPDQFLPLAESSGLIHALTSRVLAIALLQSRRWHDAGLRLQVAVNVSMDDLVSLRFPDYVADQVQQAGVPIESLVLEVTESRLMTDPLAALDILARLRLKRIGIAIDDFGTGHSSLKQLRELPFDELKIDRNFVSGAHCDPSLSAILRGALDMARHLGMRSVAEGVETQADRDYLRNLNCDVAQGYLISRPLPGEAIADWVERWEPAAIAP